MKTWIKENAIALIVIICITGYAGYTTYRYHRYDLSQRNFFVELAGSALYSCLLAWIAYFQFLFSMRRKKEWVQ